MAIFHGTRKVPLHNSILLPQYQRKSRCENSSKQFFSFFSSSCVDDLSGFVRPRQNIYSARHFCSKIQPLFFYLKKSAIFRVFRDFSLKIFLAYFKKSMFFHDIRDRRTIWERKLHVKC